jgi:Fe-Mn family superoxide dismutase
MIYELPKLLFGYSAFEPYIDSETMEVHHLGHHKTYVDKLNKTLQDYPEFQVPVEELLASLDSLPADIAKSVRQNGGGHANHTLFWSLLTPLREDLPKGPFAEALKDTFGGFSEFREKFTDVAKNHFASGWAWLVLDEKRKLQLFSTPEHESPVSKNMTPLFVLDLWEHAYYLKYQNKRADYVGAWWNLINWDQVAANLG